MTTTSGPAVGPTAPPTGVSVIATVFNEAGTVEALLDSLAAQHRPPDEIVVVDGGSTDGTVARLRAWAGAAAARRGPALRVVERPGANIAAGRNAAIAAARGPIVAVTDAGVRLVPGWLGDLVAPIEAGAARWAAGFFASDPRGAFETALGAATLPEVGEIDPARFLPSSRSVAFRKDDAEAIGGYPAWLDYGEDLVFDLVLRQRAGQPAFAPTAVARFRPRPTLGAFATQYYRYARGDGKAGLWPRRHAVRYATYVGAGPALAVLSIAHRPAWALGLAAGLVAMLARPVRRLVHQWGDLSLPGRAAALLWLPLIRVTGDVAKMVGYPAGLGWRRAHRPPRWR